MKTEHYKCPDCGQLNKAEIPEGFEDKVQKFFESIPAASLKTLVSLGVGIFVAAPAGFATAGAMLVKAIHDDGTVKCAKCGERFRIREE